MATLVFDHNLKRITIAKEDLILDIQELYNKCKEEEQFPHTAMTTGVIITAAGKEVLDPSTQVGITATMRNGWTVGWEEPVSNQAVQITGGNLVAESGVLGDQFFFTNKILIQYQASASATLATQQATEDLKFITETGTRPHHTAFGKVLYWKPITGDDTQDGTSEDNAVKTFAQAQILATDGGHDVIFIIGDSATPTTIITEAITISKNWLFLRGSGKQIEFKPTNAVAITITGLGVEVSGLTVNGVNTTFSFGIDVPSASSQFTYIHDCVFFDTTNIAINIVDSDDCIIECCEVTRAGGLGGICLVDTKNAIVRDTIITNCTQDGIYLAGVTPGETEHIVLENITSIDNAEFALDIVNNDVKFTAISPTCHLNGDTGLGRLNDNGIDTFDGEIINAVNAISPSGRSLNI